MLSIYLSVLTLLAIYATVMFIVAVIKQDNSLMDIAYGPAFILVTLYLLTATYLSDSISAHFMIPCMLVIIWGTRLAARIYRKNKGKPEDFRYASWRTLWREKGAYYFYLRSYLQIFLLQSFIVSIVSLPMIAIFLHSTATISSTFIFGCLLWFTGFLFEAVGDSQLDTFIQNPDPAKGTIMKSGLWKYTRHPNYFGESLMWWSVALVAWSITSSSVVFLSPLLITFLLLFVSGVPMLEKKWKGNAEWEEYKKKTSVFLPLPPQK